MNYELKYVELLEQNGLEVKELSEDAQIGIQQINEVMNLVRSMVRRGKNASEKTIKKIMAMDKWVCNEIIDQINETDDNEEEIPYSYDEVEEDFEDEDDYQPDDDEDDDNDEDDYDDDEDDDEDEDEDEDEDDGNLGDSPTGQKIDADLKIAYTNGKTTITLEELKNVSSTAYNIIFENYDDSGDNGIITSNFSLLETDEYVFTLEKT